MTVSNWMHVGTVLKMNAKNYPNALGWQDKNQEYSFQEWNTRACQLANGLSELGIGHRDTLAIISYNRGEWMDFYAACAKGGQVVVPVMFRLAGPEIEFIVNHSQCKGFLVEEPFVELINSIRDRLNIPDGNFIYIGQGETPPGYINYEQLLQRSSDQEPAAEVDSKDPWTIMYTSGTTGKPKGVVKSHESYMAEYYLNNINMGVLPSDKIMLVMPMCHVNSIYYSFAYTLLTAPVFIYNASSFDSEDLLACIERYQITFTSLVPTHYVMLLALDESTRSKYDVSSIRQLLISSAPARKDLKLKIMDYFQNAELWEAYGSTEGGLVTLLRPHEQFEKLGSIGREIFGTDRIKILDENRNEVPDNEVGEIFYRTPMLFDEYFQEPEKTRAAFANGWSSAGDMGYRDRDGYYYLVDRKANMIITGGENVYPSEVENALGLHEAVKDVAVIGIPHEKWGEEVKACIVLHSGFEPSEDLAREITAHCRKQLAGYKCPKSIDFISDEDMPRTPTGKLLHRELRQKYSLGDD
ncbi:MAG: AMP-binding protein [Desulfovermiculus sp.]